MKKLNEIDNNFNKKNLGVTLKKSFTIALKDPDFVKLINKFDLKEENLVKYTSKLERTTEELNNCKGCKGLSYCKNKVHGYVNYPRVEDDKLVFSYIACKYERQNLKQVSNVKYFEIPEFIQQAELSNIIQEKERLQILKYIKKFINEFENNKNIKGIYLSGSFGSGKSYIISALLNEISKKGYRSSIVYYPTLLKKLKDSFNTYENNDLDEIMTSDLLLIDDIGAENNTSWSRDEILGTILQYRMDNNKPTFFTSNLTIKELEEHLSIKSKSLDKVKSKRIIERIKQLTEEFELISPNKRS